MIPLGEVITKASGKLDDAAKILPKYIAKSKGIVEKVPRMGNTTRDIYNRGVELMDRLHANIGRFPKKGTSDFMGYVGSLKSDIGKLGYPVENMSDPKFYKLVEQLLNNF